MRTIVDAVILIVFVSCVLQREAADIRSVPPVPGQQQFASISAQCSQDLKLYFQGLANAEEWALRMYDARGRRDVTGRLDGHTQWLGRYPECKRVKPPNSFHFTENNVTKILHRSFGPKYCKSRWYEGENDTQELMSIGTCVPSTCSTDDVTKMLIANVNGEGSLPVFYTFCGDHGQLSQDGSAIAALTILSLLMAIIAAATIYDIIVPYYRLMKNSKKSNSEMMLSENPHVTVVSAVKRKSNIAPDSVNVFVLNEAEKTISKGHEAHTAHAENNTDPSATVVGAVKPGKDSTNQQDGQIQTLTTTRVPSKWEKIVLCISLKSNLPAMLSTRQPRGSYRCLNGVRFLSMAWILLGHASSIGIYITSDLTIENLYVRYPFLKMFSWHVLSNSQIAVETFFILSASLVTISFLKTTEKQGGKITKRQMLLFYIHRYIRLTPVYMIIIMMYAGFFRYIPDGPLKAERLNDSENCRVSWWTNMIYLNNFLNQDKLCMGYTWYLAADMQFFIISPIFLIALALCPISGFVIVGVLYAAHIAVTGYLNYKLRTDGGHYFTMIYNKPYCRIGSYLIGTILGYVMYKTKCKVKISKYIAVLLWLAALAAITLSVHGKFFRPHDGTGKWSLGVEVTYATLYRSGFALGVAWIIFACLTGYGGFINSLLSWKFFVPLSRVTFVGYLVHPIIMLYYYYTRYTLVYIQLSTLVWLFLGHFMLSMAAAFLLSIAFEVPVLELDKILLPRRK